MTRSVSKFVGNPVTETLNLTNISTSGGNAIINATTDGAPGVSSADVMVTLIGVISDGRAGTGVTDDVLFSL